MSNSSLFLSQLEAERSATIPPEMAPAPGRPRLKVLVCAYACSPSRGSEYGVGWGWVEAISKYHDLWVLTGAQCHDEIEAELLRRPELTSRIQFHYIPRTRYLWAEKFWPPAYLYTYKHQWQRDAYEVGRRLQEEIRFDIVHQLTYIGFRVPGLLWQLDAPFVWGPIGGLEQTTWALLPALGLHGCLYFLARNLLNDWDRRFRQLPEKAFAKADKGIIAATTGIQKEIRRFYGYDSTIISEIGLPPIIQKTPSQRSPSEPLTLVWCGNHLPGKALPFLLEALQLLSADLNWRLTILGDGPCTAHWQKIARNLGVNNRCDWLGQVPRKTVLQKMQDTHVLVITSVYDLTSTVLVEALANGIPVICPDHCGFTDAITPECGIKVPASSKGKLVLGLRDAIVRLNDETFRFCLANGALSRSTSYEWDQKARTVSDIYYSKVCGLEDSLSSSDSASLRQRHVR
jgi:glycosyltransferase involved in cell wall biosynthesis